MFRNEGIIAKFSTNQTVGEVKVDRDSIRRRGRWRRMQPYLHPVP